MNSLLLAAPGCLGLFLFIDFVLNSYSKATNYLLLAAPGCLSLFFIDFVLHVY